MEHVITIIAVAVGWFLKEVSNFIKGYAERLKTVNKSLSLLLEVRHTSIAYINAIETIKDRLNVPPEIMPQIRQMIGVFVKVPPDIVIKYEQSVEDIAQYDPVLAFSFRRQSLIPELLSFFDNLSLPPSEQNICNDTLSPIIEKTTIKGLTEKLSDLACYTNRKNRRDIKKHLQRKFECDDDLEEFVATVKKLIDSSVKPEQTA